MSQLLIVAGLLSKCLTAGACGFEVKKGINPGGSSVEGGGELRRRQIRDFWRF